MHLLEGDDLSSEHFGWDFTSAAMESLAVDESSMLNGKAPEDVG